MRVVSSIFSLTLSQLRPHENAISTLSSNGIPAPLSSYNRKPKQNTRDLVLNDGYNVKQTSNQALMQHPSNHAVKSKHTLSMVNRYNMNELSLADRPLMSATREGFGSAMPSHSRQHE
jgi:hypothetical protein